MLQEECLNKNTVGVCTNAQVNRISLPSSLPEDLLGEIFWMCLPVAHNPTFSPRDAPLLLTRVCHYWRSVAITLPSIWRSLHIPLDLPAPDAKLALIDEWIERARSLPLSISFSQPPAGDPLTASRFTSYLKRLQNKPDPLEALTINFLGGEDGMRTFVSELDETGFNPLRTVRKLDIHSNITDPHIFIRDICGFGALNLHENSNLRLLKISAPFYIFCGPDPHVSLAWTNLRVLDLQTQNFWEDNPTTINNGAVLTVMSMCSRLTEARAFSSSMMSSNFGHPVLNPKLRHASLLFMDLQSMDDMANLIAQTDWPLLSSLHLGIWRLSPERSDMQIVQKWGSRLTSLRITHPFVVQKHLIYCISHLPSLIQLHIEDGVIRGLCLVGGSDGATVGSGEECAPDGVLEPLTPQGPKPSSIDHCCPQLQYFRWDGRTEFSDKAVINLINNRALSPASPVQLKQVVINFHRGPQEDVGSACASQVVDGLRLRLTYNVPCPRNIASSGKHRALKLDEHPLEMGWM